jgi:hypothetical protein
MIKKHIMVSTKYRNILKKSPTIKRYARWYYTKKKAFNWLALINNSNSLWKNLIENSINKKQILIATSVGYNMSATTVESLLAVALTLRNAHVDILLCDAALPACMACEISLYRKKHLNNDTSLSKKLCKTCKSAGYNAFNPLGLPIINYSDFVNKGDIEKVYNIITSIENPNIQDFKYKNIAVGEHAYAGALRFFARGDLKNENYSDRVLKQYLEASILTTFMIKRLLKHKRYDVVVFNHGIYIPHGIIGEVCRDKNIKIVNWNPAYKKQCFIFSHENTYHHTMISDPVAKWINMRWNDEKEHRLQKYLEQRWYGKNDWIWFQDKPVVDIQSIKKILNIDFRKPTIGLLTNVIWDAALHYHSNTFNNMLQWINETIKYFRNRKDLQLIIRIHPAEIQGGLPSRQLVYDEIRKNFKKLPDNIIVIKPDNRVSTYRIMKECDSVLIYNTKTGIELSAIGIHVIVAGEAWVRNKNISIDVECPKKYIEVLNTLPLNKRMNSKQLVRAKKFAYYFFFQRMIPVKFMKQQQGNPPFRIDADFLEKLLPGNCRGLDTICEGILNQKDFIYKNEND